MKLQEYVDYGSEKSWLNFGRLAHLLVAGNDTVVEVCALLSALWLQAAP